MTERKRDTGAKRISILDAAQQAFISEGYEHTSMDRIAEFANASKRTVYNHFPSKDDLFRAVLNRCVEESLALKRIQYDPKRSLEAQLGDFAEAKMALIKSPTSLGLLKVITGVAVHSPELVRDTVMRAEDKEDSLAIWIKAAIQDGHLKARSPKLAAGVFWAMIGGAFFWPTIFVGASKTREQNAMKKELIAVFLARYTA